MSKSPAKIALSKSIDIPYNKLVISEANVRRIKNGVTIEQLAEDIARRTLLQSLSVRAMGDVEGANTGIYEIQAGGRRFQALTLLVKQKRLAKTALIPCVLREAGLAEEDSLAENTHREALHPLDQFRAFKDLLDRGHSESDIAAKFYVTPSVVKQRLRLAAVSCKLHDAYASGDMTLDQLMAFTVTDDHARQEQLWDLDSDIEPYKIRNRLTEHTVRMTDRRARFIGAAAYEAAGGIITRDLFSDAETGYMDDPALLDLLVAEKLAAVGASVKAEGWKWVESALQFPYGAGSDKRRIDGEEIDIRLEEGAAREALQSRLHTLDETHNEADDWTDELMAEADQLEAAINAYEERPLRYDPEEMARAGTYVSVSQDGTLLIERGYVAPQDEPDAESATDANSGTTDAPQPQPPAATSAASVRRNTDMTDDEPAEDGMRPLSEKLVTELTAHRTLALRDALANNVDVAMTTILHALCLQTFYGRNHSCLELSTIQKNAALLAPGLTQCASFVAIIERHGRWGLRLPKKPEHLWSTIDTMEDPVRGELLAHCVSLLVNATHEPFNRNAERLHHANVLASAVSLDMAAAGWTPTVDAYLGRVAKSRILDAVREGKGDTHAQLIEHLKKGDMAQEAERMLAGSGWLPEVLRTHSVTETSSLNMATSDMGTGVLPDFLDAGDDAPEGTAVH